MKRIIGWLLLLVIAGGALTAWLLFGATTAFDEKSRYFIVREGQTNKEAVLAILKEEKNCFGHHRFTINWFTHYRMAQTQSG